MSAIKAGVVGAAGYTGGEVIRLLLGHPAAELVFCMSQSSAGKKLHEVHHDLLGESDMCFSSGMDFGVDAIFLCLGHGEARKFLENNDIPQHIRIIDLSQDFRLEANKDFQAGNGPVRSFVYGLPELDRASIRQASNIANPGCFATAIQLGLLPLAAAGELKSEVHTTAITGSTGAGQLPGPTTHFSWRSGNLSVYKAFTHQHLAEISRGLAAAGRKNGKAPQTHNQPEIQLIPYRGDFTRGIIVSSVLSTGLDLDAARKLYLDFYKEQVFTWISETNVDLKQVVGTNKCFISLEQGEGKLLIVSIIDNLLKGASGQAVQNFNLMFGLAEDAGLRLKSIVY